MIYITVAIKCTYIHEGTGNRLFLAKEQETKCRILKIQEN